MNGFCRAAVSLTVVGAMTAMTAACGSDSASSDVEVVAPWARTSSSVATNGAVYMTLRSATDQSLIGVDVESSVAERAEILETVVVAQVQSVRGATAHDGEDHGTGSMSTHPVSSLRLHRGEDVVFEPGGYRVMLLGLAAPLESGSHFDMTLSLDSGESLVVSVPVRDDAP